MRKLTKSHLKVISLILSLILIAETAAFISIINVNVSYARNLDLGNKYLLTEDYDSAINAFSKAIEIDAMNADAYIGRGDAYKARGDYANAWNDYEKAQELTGNTSILRDKIGVTDITVVSGNGAGIDGAAVRLTGSTHSYELVTDSTGHISEVIFPEKYNMVVTGEDYEPVNTDLLAEHGGITVDQIQLTTVGEKITSLLSDYVSLQNFMYGKSCTYTLYRISNTGQYDTQWDGIAAGELLGYYIDDFDNDGVSELLMLRLVNDLSIQLEMYEVIDGKVELAASKVTDTNTVYGAVSLPHGMTSLNQLCGLLSGFVRKSDHKIFLQSSEKSWIIADGNGTFIISAIYKDGNFWEYSTAWDVGSDIDEGIPEDNQDLLNMGVPSPDFYNIFYNLMPLYQCFDEELHEIIHAEQQTIDIVQSGSRTTKVVTQTTFSTMGLSY